MRTEICAGLLRRKARNVGYQHPIVGRVIVRGGEGANRPGFDRKRRDRRDHVLLQLLQFRSILDQNASNACLASRRVVIPYGFQLQGRDFRPRQHPPNGRIDVVKLVGADEPLDQRDVWLMRLVQFEAGRVGLEQPGVTGLSMDHHGRVRHDQNIDSRHRNLLGRAHRFDLSHQGHHDDNGQCGQHSHVFLLTLDRRTSGAGAPQSARTGRRPME